MLRPARAPSNTALCTLEKHRLSSPVELRRLQYFAVLAEELHFRRAAERLHIAQPGLTQQIRVLERELGAVLFERSTAGVTLTDAGRALRDEGVPLLREVERVAALVRAAAEGRTRTAADRAHAGRWPAGYPTSWCAPSGSGIPTPRSRSRPHGRPGTSPWCAPRRPTPRSSGCPLHDADDLRLLTLGQTELVVVLPATHPLARRRVVRPADLRDVQPRVLAARTGARLLRPHPRRRSGVSTRRR